jgi:hypothetical protein
MGSTRKHAFESANNKMGLKRPDVIRQDNSGEEINHGKEQKKHRVLSLELEKWYNSRGKGKRVE